MSSYTTSRGERHALHPFHGGLHLEEHKAESNGGAIITAPVPEYLILPLQQHIGTPGKSLVAPGDRVLKGQIIAAPQGYVSAALHAPTSGEIIAVESRPVPHPSGLAAPCILLRSDGTDSWSPDLPAPWPDYQGRSAAELRQRIRDCGIVGLGGASFPTPVKLEPGPDRPIRTLILNGVECEPYITCDDRLMRERPESVLQGARILMHILGAEECLVGVEDNKPEAIQALRDQAEAWGDRRISLVPVPTLYPSGGEKQLIYLLTGREVPRQALPSQLGLVCQNVGTAAAIADAVLRGQPLLSRIVTLSGDGFSRPGNFEVLLGTPVSDLLPLAGGLGDATDQLVLGGPMMGFNVRDPAVPVTKGSNCVLALTRAGAPAPQQPQPCIRCGECVKVCPAKLLPQQLYWHARAKELEKAQDYHLFDCIECGCCSYVCPSHIPLVQYFRFAKTESWAKEQERRQAEQAKRRHDHRQQRLERLERERQTQMAKRQAALKQDRAGAKATVAAAVQRAAARKNTTPDQPADGS